MSNLYYNFRPDVNTSSQHRQPPQQQHPHQQQPHPHSHHPQLAPPPHSSYSQQQQQQQQQRAMMAAAAVNGTLNYNPTARSTTGTASASTSAINANARGLAPMTGTSSSTVAAPPSRGSANGGGANNSNSVLNSMYEDTGLLQMLASKYHPPTSNPSASDINPSSTSTIPTSSASSSATSNNNASSSTLHNNANNSLNNPMLSQQPNAVFDQNDFPSLAAATNSAAAQVLFAPQTLDHQTVAAAAAAAAMANGLPSYHDLFSVSPYAGADGRTKMPSDLMTNAPIQNGNQSQAQSAAAAAAAAATSNNSNNNNPSSQQQQQHASEFNMQSEDFPALGVRLPTAATSTSSASLGIPAASVSVPISSSRTMAGSNLAQSPPPSMTPSSLHHHHMSNSKSFMARQHQHQQHQHQHAHQHAHQHHTHSHNTHHDHISPLFDRSAQQQASSQSQHGLIASQQAALAQQQHRLQQHNNTEAAALHQQAQTTSNRYHLTNGFDPVSDLHGVTLNGNSNPGRLANSANIPSSTSLSSTAGLVNPTSSTNLLTSLTAANLPPPSASPPPSSSMGLASLASPFMSNNVSASMSPRSPAPASFASQQQQVLRAAEYVHSQQQPGHHVHAPHVYGHPATHLYANTNSSNNNGIPQPSSSTSAATSQQLAQQLAAQSRMLSANSTLTNPPGFAPVSSPSPAPSVSTHTPTNTNPSNSHNKQKQQQQLGDDGPPVIGPGSALADDIGAGIVADDRSRRIAEGSKLLRDGFDEPPQARDESTSSKSKVAEKKGDSKFGMSALRASVTPVTDANIESILCVGLDLTNLGLNLTAARPLHNSFDNPFNGGGLGPLAGNNNVTSTASALSGTAGDETASAEQDYIGTNGTLHDHDDSTTPNGLPSGVNNKPWVDAPSSTDGQQVNEKGQTQQNQPQQTKEVGFRLPTCYYMQPPGLRRSHFTKFQLETLLYIFYNMPRDVLQVLAAMELYKRKWMYHKDLKLWFSCDADATQSAYEHGKYVYFDIRSWGRRPFHDTSATAPASISVGRQQQTFGTIEGAGTGTGTEENDKNSNDNSDRQSQAQTQQQQQSFVQGLMTEEELSSVEMPPL